MTAIDKDDIISIMEESIDSVNIPTTLPLMPVRDIVIFPDMIIPLFVGREKSVSAIDESITENKLLLLVTQKNPEVDNPKPEDMYNFGTVVRILKVLKVSDGRIKALVQGVKRAKVIKFIGEKKYFPRQIRNC